jgi:hypothetical protein
MKTAPVVARRSVVRRKAMPVAKATRAQRAVPALSGEEESFLSGISSSDNFTIEKVLFGKQFSADVQDPYRCAHPTGDPF